MNNCYWDGNRWVSSAPRYYFTDTVSYKDPTQAKVIEQLLKRIADLEARLDKK